VLTLERFDIFYLKRFDVEVVEPEQSDGIVCICARLVCDDWRLEVGVGLTESEGESFHTKGEDEVSVCSRSVAA
jgi:hypothetical protein